MNKIWRILSPVVLLGLVACAGVPSDVPRTGMHDPGPLPIADAGPCCGPVTPKAQKLLAILNASDVEHLWLPDEHAEWETGASHGYSHAANGERTSWCSSFVAAMSLRTGVYVLRPPQHTPRLLASAQVNWLGSAEGQSVGWFPVKTPVQAQALANAGYLVVIGHASLDPTLSGHIAIVRPNATRTLAEIKKWGPLLTQAGYNNYMEVPMRRIFGKRLKMPITAPDRAQMFAHPLSDRILAVTDPREGLDD